MPHGGSLLASAIWFSAVAAAHEFELFFWRKIGEVGRQARNFVAMPLKSLALPRGLEPLFSP